MATYHNTCYGSDSSYDFITLPRVRELRLCSIILIQKAFRRYTANGRFEEVVQQVDSKREAAQVSQV